MKNVSRNHPSLIQLEHSITQAVIHDRQIGQICLALYEIGIRHIAYSWLIDHRRSFLLLTWPAGIINLSCRA